MKYFRLDQLQQGSKGKVAYFKAGYRLVNKLNALGIRKGKEITKISNAFIGGPVTIKTGNTKIAIGNGMAAKIIIEVEEEE